MIKLHLDLPALERLIAGDNDVEIAIREGVVQSFAKRHLKAVANSEAMQPYLKKVSAAINRELKKSIPMVLQMDGTFILDSKGQFCTDLLQAIQKTAHANAMDVINTKLNSVWRDIQKKAIAQIERSERRLRYDIETEVKNQITTQFEATVQKEVARRIKAVTKNLS